MTKNNRKNLHDWLNLGVDFNPGSPKYDETANAVEVKLGTDPATELAPVDQRIQQFMNEVFGEDGPQLVQDTFLLDQHGLARTIA